MTINGRSVAVIFALTFIGFSSVPAAVHAESAGVTDPEKWYAESYGPLWHDNAWDKVNEILFYYDSEVWDHSADGEPVRNQADIWIRDAMKEWRAEGWTGSEVPDIRINRINDMCSAVNFL